MQPRLRPSAPEFKANLAHHLELLRPLQDAVETVRAGASPEAVARHRARGKLQPREGIDRIVDPGTPFLELSPLAAWRAGRGAERKPDGTPPGR
ncbi:MAG: hypothetical protein AAF628_23960 [Planctomycetota bacterium]